MLCWSLLIGAGRLHTGARRFSRADDSRIQRITAEHFPGGFTILGATGGWFDPDLRRFVVEESRQILICGAQAGAVRRWAVELGRALRQKELVVMRLGAALRLRIAAGRNPATRRGSVSSTMATKRNNGSDRGRVSSQRHEISYAGKKLGRGGAARVRKAKAALGRKTGRQAVMKRARAAAR
jgi:hypothetical protein